MEAHELLRPRPPCTHRTHMIFPHTVLIRFTGLLARRVNPEQRHWDQIVKTTAIGMQYEPDFALRDLLDAGLQNFCAEIEEV